MTEPDDSQATEKNRKRLLWAALFIVGIFCVCSIMNLATASYPFCVSDQWCFDSGTRPFLVAAFQTLSFLLVILGLVLGTRLAVQMLVSKRAYLYFALFFFAVGLFGSTVWFLTVEPADRMEFIHVPIIGLGCVLLGVLFLLYFPGGLRKRSVPSRPEK
ncbi:MAG TPA: hypothetical protein DEA96_14445 [Leptospiraceae bacterium]|nr:hypothetical protein [Spirochaetaceae bacterium]HBS06164.1 hypothetical protein [Leptospiraceae bacterium]|tara:strand:- start:141 stop:617 length:477 start_codon:yes stop_codon:yes gene_type:complete